MLALVVSMLWKWHGFAFGFLRCCSRTSGVLQVSARTQAVHRIGSEFSVSRSLITIRISQKNSQLLAAQWPV